MKIVFMGSPDFAVVSLRQLQKAGHEIMAVVTVPDKPRGRGQIMLPSPVKQEALLSGLPVFQPQDLRDPQFLVDLSNLNADVFVVVAFRILPVELFSIPPHGTINVHASLLPKYRGAAPINWAIINGEHETGITIIRIDTKVDTGNILKQEKVKITAAMTAGQLHDALAVRGALLLTETLGILDQINPSKQNEELATKAPKIKRETCRIDFSLPAKRIVNLINGLSPKPTAFCIYNTKIMKIYSAVRVDNYDHNSKPGQVLVADGKDLVIACGSGAIKILEIQLPGKKRLTIKDFYNGNSLNSGEIFT